MNQLRLTRKPEALSVFGISKSTLYAQIKHGLMTPPVKVGTRSVAWPSNEIDAIRDARISGKDDAEIMALVKKLESTRSMGA